MILVVVVQVQVQVCVCVLLCHTAVYKAALKSVDDVTPGSMWKRLKFRIVDVIKRGAKDLDLTGERVIEHFYLSKTCTMCEDFFQFQRRQRGEAKRFYLIFGKESTPLVLEAGSRIMPFPGNSCLRNVGMDTFIESMKAGRICR